MTALAGFCERCSGAWWSYVVQAGWQSAVVGILVLAVVWLGRRWPSPLRYGLLVLALVKFAVPPLVTAPSALWSPWPTAEVAADRPPVLQTVLQRLPDAASTPLADADPSPTQMPKAAPTLGPGRILHLNGGFMLLHAFGFVAVIAWLLGQSRRMRRILRDAYPVREDRVVQQFKSLCQQIGVGRRPGLVASHCDCSPFSFGLLRPTIVLPQSLIDRLSSEDLRIVLAHELAHHRRRDLWVNSLQAVLCAAWWFHPIVWLVNRSLRSVREDCCDDLLLARSWAAVDEYCEALLRVAKDRACHGSAALAVPMATGPQRLARRFRRIMDGTVRRSARLSPVGLGILVLLGACLLPGARPARHDGIALAGATGPNTGSGLPPQQAPAKTIRGKVVDENGRPIAGAELWMPVFLPERRVLSTRSDSKGEFTLGIPLSWIPKMRPGNTWVTIWTYAAGRQLNTGPSPLGWCVLQNPPETVIPLGPATETEFVVLDPQGQPKAGALVEPRRMRVAADGPVVPEELLPRIGARTNAQGRAKLPAIAHDRLDQVRVTTEDLGIQEQRFYQQGFPSSRHTFRLRPAGKIEGRVIADQPEVARGVRVTFETMDSSKPLPATAQKTAAASPFLSVTGAAEVVSDEQGRFVVPAIASGRLTIEGHVDEAIAFRPKVQRTMSLYVKAGETTTVEISMAATVTARGSVVATDTGKPVSGATIHISNTGLGRGLFLVSSDAQGRFTVPVLPGRCTVYVSSGFGQDLTNYCQLGGPSNRAYDVPEGVKEFDWPPIYLSPTKSISGRVIDQNDQPVASVMISIVDGDAHYGTTRTDANGLFTSKGVPTMIDPGKATYRIISSNRAAPPPNRAAPPPDRGAPRLTFVIPLLENEVIQAAPLLIRVRLDKQELKAPPQGKAGGGMGGGMGGGFF